MISPVEVMGIVTPGLLLLARAYGMLLAIPPLLKPGQARTVRIPIAMAIALPSFLSVYPLVEAEGSMPLARVVWLGLRELGIGAFAGLFLYPLFGVPRAAGTLIDQQAGLMNIQLLDPTAAERTSTAFADLFEQCALVSFILCGGLGALSELCSLSYAIWPIDRTGFPATEQTVRVLFAGAGQFMMRAATFAAPFVVVLLALEYGVGLVGRATPQLNVLTSSVAMKICAALLIILGGVPAAMQEFPGWLDQVMVMAKDALEFSEPANNGP